MRVLAGSNCSTGPCPTLYRADDGKLYIQGFKVDATLRASVNVPGDEDLVEISEALLENIKAVG